jgi:hypothetical protein
MGCGCGKKQISKRGGSQPPPSQAPVKSDSAKTPLQVRKERVNKLVSIPGTKPK